MPLLLRRFFWIAIRTSVSALITLPAHAEIFVDKSIVEFQAEQAPRQDVRIFNNGNEVSFIQMDVLEIKNPGTPNETRTSVSDNEKAALIATPMKVAIPAHTDKLVRLVYLDNSNEEKIYRVNITPILPPLQEPPKNSTVRVVVAYQLLVIARPQTPKEEFSVQRKGRKMTIKNTGNSNVLFSDGQQCNAKIECTSTPSERVYAGNTWEFDLPSDAPVSYSITGIHGVKQVVY